MATLTIFRLHSHLGVPSVIAAVALIAAACGGSGTVTPTAPTPEAVEESPEAAVQSDPAEEPAEEDPTTQATEPGKDDAAPVESEQAEPEAESSQSTADAETEAEEASAADDQSDPDPLAPLGDPTPYDNDNAIRILKTLVVDIGERVHGTQGERDAAEFLKAEFEASGYAVEFQPVPLESRQVEALRLTVDGAVVEAAVFDSSAGGDVGGRLVVVPGFGDRADFARVDVEGAIALVERGVLFFSDKVANAAAGGATGIVIFNNEPGLFSGTLVVQAGLPVIAISRADGLALRDQAAAAELDATILVRFDELSGVSQNVIARHPDGVCRVWVGGHYDTVPGVTGANDNGSGTAIVVELARAYAGTAAGQQICFAGFGAEEASGGSPGILGSRILAQSLIDSGELGIVTAMLNLDVAGAGGQVVALIGDPPLVDQSMVVAQALGIEARPGSLPANAGSDHLNFTQLSIPVIFPTVNGGPIHVPEDNFLAVQPERLDAVGRLAHGILGCLAASAAPGAATIEACAAPAAAE